MTLRPIRLALVALLTSAMLGCDRDQPSAQPAPADAAKGQPVAPAPGTGVGPVEPTAPSPIPPHASAGDATAYTGDGISWTLPPGWSQQPASGMRYATLVPPAGPEVSVTRLGGGGGGNLANINRWRGQVFLPPITEAQIPAETTPVDLGGVTALRVDIVGPQGRILGALIPGRAGQTWFLKAQTPTAEAMDPIVPAFDALLTSVRVAR